MDLSISYIYGEALGLSKKHGLKILCLVLITMAVGVGFMFLTMPEGYVETYSRAMQGNLHAMTRLQQMEPSAVGMIAQYLVSFFFSVVLYRALIGYTRSREMTLVDAFKVNVMTYLKYVGTTIIVFLAIIAGCLLLIVPGIYVSVRLIWATMYIVEHPESSIKEAISWSWRTTKGHWMDLFCLFLIAMVMIIAAVILVAILAAFSAISNILGIVAIVVGFVVLLMAIVMVYFAQTKTYCELA